MITLYGFGRFLGTPDSSPFVIKTMVLLKLAGLSYAEVRGNPLKAPKKFLPYIEDEGKIVADSSAIRAHIESKYGFDFDAGLAEHEKASAWAIERMCEDHLYFAMLDYRWRDRVNFRKGVGKMFGVVPFLLRPFAKALLRRANAKRLIGHGLGRLDKATIAAQGSRDLAALSTLLGSKAYIMGDAPTGADATVFGIVTAILTPQLDTPMRSAALRLTNLVAYRDRLTARFFASPSPDLT